MSSIQPVMPASRWDAYWRLMRLDRPIGILLLLWPTLWALWLAGQGRPAAGNAVIFVLGVIIMRSAGCVMNDYADRGFDPHVERTRQRPLAAGAVSPRAALVLLGTLLAAAFLLVLMTNALTVKLAFAGGALALAYPFFKRVTHLPQLVLGIAFGWGIPMAFAAETGQVPPLAWWLLAINVLYATIYDTEYAMVDRDDDIAIGVKSTAILLGKFDRAALAVLMAAMLGLMLWLGLDLGFTWPWYAGIAVAGGLFAYQQIIIRGRQRDACFRAFMNNNWVGLAVFAGLLGHYTVS